MNREEILNLSNEEFVNIWCNEETQKSYITDLLAAHGYTFKTSAAA